MSELHWAWRSIIRSPASSAAAVLTFALGIGINVALFSVIDRLLFRPLPFSEPERLVQIHTIATRGQSPALYASQQLAQALAERATSIEAVAVTDVGRELVRFSELGDARLRLGSASPNLLAVLGVSLLAGSSDRPDEHAGTARPLLLTWSAWRAWFGGDPAVIGRTLRGAGGRCVIVGVLPPDFLLPSSRLVQVDGVMLENQGLAAEPQPGRLTGAAIARLRPGVSLAQARGEVDAIYRGLKPEGGLGTAVHVQPLQRGMSSLYRTELSFVALAGAIALLIACLNLTTLLLARSRVAARTRAVRAALGAPAWRLTALSLLETLIVCTAGTLMALVVFAGIQQSVLAIVPPAFRGFSVAPLDVRLLATSILATCAAAMLAGAAPSWQACRTDPLEALRAAGGPARRLRGGGVLLAAQAAFGVLLVAGAALIVGSFLGLLIRDPGWTLDNLYVVTVDHGHKAAYDETQAGRRAERAVEAVRDAPGVLAAAVANIRPFDRYALIDDPWKEMGITDGGSWGVTADFFAAMELRMRAGRGFTADEVTRNERLVVLNETAARRLWADADVSEAIGRRIRAPGGERVVAGVVGDVRRYPGDDRVPGMYLPVTAEGVRFRQSSLEVLVRMRPGLRPDPTSIKRRLDERFGPDLVDAPQAVTGMLEAWWERPRFLAALFGAFAAVALVLASVGVFAVAAFDVSRRRHELAVRSALGAAPRDLRRLVHRRVLAPVAAGCAAGVAASWWTAQYARTLVVDIEPQHPGIHSAVALLLLAVAAAAARIPMRRLENPAAVLRAL